MSKKEVFYQKCLEEAKKDYNNIISTIYKYMEYFEQIEMYSNGEYDCKLSEKEKAEIDKIGFEKFSNKIWEQFDRVEMNYNIVSFYLINDLKIDINKNGAFKLI